MPTGLTAGGARPVPRPQRDGRRRDRGRHVARWIPRTSPSCSSRAEPPGPPKAGGAPPAHTWCPTSWARWSSEAPDEDEAALVSVPPYHIAGMAAVASSVYSGRRIVQLPNFDGRGWLELARERADHQCVRGAHHAGPHRRALEGMPRSRAAAPARHLAYGGGKMPLLGDRAGHDALPRDRLHQRLRAHRDELDPHRARSGGPPRGHGERRPDGASAPRLRGTAACRRVEIEIRDDGREGPQPRGRARRDPRARRAGLRRVPRSRQPAPGDGFFPTRDGGWLDEGRLPLHRGPVDDIIVRGGENMSPGEIEDVLLEHPASPTVAVVGIPDEQWGEAVAAAVVLQARHDGVRRPEALQQWVKDRGCAPRERPSESPSSTSSRTTRRASSCAARCESRPGGGGRLSRVSAPAGIEGDSSRHPRGEASRVVLAAPRSLLANVGRLGPPAGGPRPATACSGVDLAGLLDGLPEPSSIRLADRDRARP